MVFFEGKKKSTYPGTCSGSLCVSLCPGNTRSVIVEDVFIKF